VDFSFNPNGDFVWVISLGSDVTLDRSRQNVFAARDFSNTIDAE
jgi:hypothetical protein